MSDLIHVPAPEGRSWAFPCPDRLRDLLVRLRTPVLLALCLGSLALPLAAQQPLALKRSIPTPGASSECGTFPAPQPASETRQAEARRLQTAANQASILGDGRTSRDLLRQAAELDPRDADLAYRLARANEEIGDTGEAVIGYCRYLALAPNAAGAEEVRDRIAALPSSQPELSARAVAQFRYGIQYYDRGRFGEAERAFAAAIQQDPNWSEALYNRALARAAQSQPQQAIEDLEAYLRLEPTDSVAVRTGIDSLRERILPFTPSGALARGLLVPGLGQFHTRRPGLGALVLGGVGAAVYVAFLPKEVSVTRQNCPFPDTCFPYEDTAVERPTLAAGLGVAAALSLLGAWDAYAYAKRAQQRNAGPVAPAAANHGAERRWTPTLGAFGDRVQLGISVGVGAPASTPTPNRH